MININNLKSLSNEKKINWFSSLIVYEDQKIVAINKPSGIAVQGGTGIVLSIDDILSILPQKYRIVHRIDRDTTGLLIFAKHEDVARRLAKKFKERSIEKFYLALVRGEYDEKFFRVDEPLMEKKIGNEKLMMVNKIGKNAITNFEVLDFNQSKNISLLKISIETGRKHQIRAHLNFLKTPIVGDQKYNFKEKKGGLMLHSYIMNFDFGSKKYELKARLSKNFSEYLEFLNLNY